MSLLREIEKLGIKQEDLPNLTDQEIIRIEKKLKVEARINQTLDVNQIERIINVIKNNKEELAILYSPPFNTLKTILIHPNRIFLVMQDVEIGDGIDIEKIRVFLMENFNVELETYIENCIKKGYYNALFSLLKYKKILSVALLDSIQNKLSIKLRFAIECLRISVKEMGVKINFTTNPFFFRTLSELGSSLFEENIGDLTNTVIDELKDPDLKLRVLFSLSYFIAQADDLQDTLARNRSAAEKRGIVEVPIDPITNKKTGGTSLDKTYRHRSTPSDKKDKSKKEITGWRILLAAVICFIFILKCGGFKQNSNDSRNGLLNELKRNTQDYLIEEEEKIAISSPKGAFPEIMEDEETFINTINYIHEHEDSIVNEISVPFEMGYNTDFSFENTNIIIHNHSYSPMLLYLKFKSFDKIILIKPFKEIVVQSDLIEFRIYSGVDPKMVDYIDENGETKTHFIFGYCSYTKLRDFNSVHTFDYGDHEKNNYKISIEGDGRYLEVTMQEILEK